MRTIEQDFHNNSDRQRRELNAKMDELNRRKASFLVDAGAGTEEN